MAEIMTVAGPPGRGALGEGLMLHGRHPRAEVIRQMRAMYARNLEAAQRILAMSDDEFEVTVVRGVHRQRLIERLAPDAPVPSPLDAALREPTPPPDVRAPGGEGV